MAAGITEGTVEAVTADINAKHGLTNTSTKDGTHQTDGRIGGKITMEEQNKPSHR